MPNRLGILAAGSLVLAGVSALIIAIDLLRGHRQRMWIMNIVWPITALYSGPLGLWAYFAIGRNSVRHETGREKPLWQSVGLAATHCGSGCTLGDLLAEGAVLSYLPLSLFGHRIFGAWLVDYVLAFVFGVAFQYFTIAPMKRLSPKQGLLAALKADSLSLTAWQVGMYGWMAIATFLIFGHEIDKGSPTFWFMMQVAMLAGFATSYPINWWLVKTGFKEKM